MIATLDTTRERRRRAARRQWRDPLVRARILCGQILYQERCRVEKLVRDHLHLLDTHARYFAARYPGLDREDARQAGFAGLQRAAERYDPHHRSGATFSTWAFTSVRDAIQRELPNLLGTIRVPRRAAFPRPIFASLDDADGAPEPEDEGTASDPYEVACRAEDRDRLRVALGRLRNPRDGRVLRLRYALDGGMPMTLREIGDVLGVGIERARQLELRALAELRAALAE